MKDEVLNTSAAAALRGRHSSICDPSRRNSTLHTECKMGHDLRFPSPLPVFSCFVPFEGPWGSLSDLGIVTVTDDKPQTQQRGGNLKSKMAGEVVMKATPDSVDDTD